MAAGGTHLTPTSPWVAVRGGGRTLSPVCCGAALGRGTGFGGGRGPPPRRSSPSACRQTSLQSALQRSPARVGRSPRKMFSPTLSASTRLSSW